MNRWMSSTDWFIHARGACRIKLCACKPVWFHTVPLSCHNEKFAWRSGFLSMHFTGTILPTLGIKNNAAGSPKIHPSLYVLKYTMSEHGVHQIESECAQKRAQYRGRWFTTPPRHLLSLSYTIHARWQAESVVENLPHSSLPFWRTVTIQLASQP